MHKYIFQSKIKTIEDLKTKPIAKSSHKSVYGFAKMICG